MLKTVLIVFWLAFPALVAAQQSISVYQLDGSVNCHSADITTAEQASESLKQAGVKVVSGESRSVPFDLSGQCGTPTGKANVLVVDAADWKRLVRKTPDALGFGVWVFDRPLIEVYKYDGSLQCRRGKEIALQDMAGELTAKGIEVKASRKGNDGRRRIAMCGASTGSLNVYTIATSALPGARELGFRLLITRQISSEIQSPVSARRLSPQLRTPPPPAGSTNTQIPQLW